MRDSFYDEEVICGYTVSAEMKRRWSVSLDLLEKFTAVCNKHKLRHYAVFGTLLGAVRHKGFIPWDDDIDMAMPRSDFELLEKAAPEEFGFPYFFQTATTDPRHFTGVARLRNSNTTHICPNERYQRGNRGCYIDIIVLDPMHENAVKRKWQCERAKLLRKLLICKHNYYDHYVYLMPKKLRLTQLISKAFSHDTLTKRYEKSNQCCYKKYTRYIGNPSGGYYFDKAVFADTINMEFEHLTIPVPAGYGEFIKTVWGSVELPEDGERKPRHGGTVDVGTPYTDGRYNRHMNTFKGITNEKILLFGAGRNACRYIKRHGKRFPPVCIFDNDPQKWGTTINGIPVGNPKDLPGMAGGARIIIASVYRREISEQLEKMGLCEYYIYDEGKKYAEG
jgi:lipopolysaccharide cholinephosphotransferase